MTRIDEWEIVGALLLGTWLGFILWWAGVATR
jgi:hypothetical protein